jgi:hypothetical protein
LPYSSLAQARLFHSDPKLKKYAAEYDAATDFSKLPEHVGPKKYRGRSVLHELSKHPHKRKHRRH